MNKAIEWFARNHVAANLLMLLIVFMGLRAALVKVPLEVFPTFELDIITVHVSLPGATPEEAEEGLAIRIEEAIYDLEGIEEITSISREGGTTVSIEVQNDQDLRELMSDIKTRVDAINTFPADAERPVVYQAQRNREVISVTVSGPLNEKELRDLGTEVREELLALDGITQVYLESVRPFEISIEIPEPVLRRYQLTLAQIARQIEEHSLDLSAGLLRTRGGEILIRTKNQAYTTEDYAAIPVRTEADGTRIKLGDIAQIRDTFDQSPINVRFNGQDAVLIEVYRIGSQNAITVADTIKEYVRQKQETLPDKVKINTWRDRSVVVKARLKTLGNSALQGGILVALLLSLFLRPAIAFWVCVGIPVSFLGGFWFMALQDITLNLISLFAFITVLGIVVDDAIVTGENIYFHLQRGEPPLEAAIIGTKEVSVPVTFGVLTTVAAFYPLMNIEGVRGQIFAQIPLIVIPVLLFSLIESKFVLPSHLKHVRQVKDSELGRLSRLQRRIADGFEQAILRYYKPLLHRCLQLPVLPLALATGLMIIMLALIMGGWTRFVFFPRVPSEIARATLTMPTGTSFERTDKGIDHMVSMAQRLQEKYRDPESGQSAIINILATTGSAGGTASGQSHLGRVLLELQPPESRVADVKSAQLVKEWRKLIGSIPGMESMTMRAEIGRGGSPIDIQLTGQDFKQLRNVSDQIKKHLSQYPGIFDIEDSLSSGKQELQIQLLPQGAALGLTQAELARQVRYAFFGYEVQRILRGRDDVRVYLRYSGLERSSLSTLDSLLIRTPDNHEIPFVQVAALSPGQSPSEILRIGQRRALNVTADLDKQSTDVEAIKRSLDEYLGDLLSRYPGISYSLEGEAKEQRQSFSGLESGLVLVLFVIYGLLAIPFRSYWQPFIVMSMIPFGAMGAVIGHWIMGMPLTIMSLMGMLALTGVVVNDSLVLVDYINRRRREGTDLLTAVHQAGVARFRAVILTSLTTFAGLMPLIFDKTTQAQFLIPMAISLGFGILFATFFTLLLLPVNYLIFVRSGAWLRRNMSFRGTDFEGPSHN